MNQSSRQWVPSDHFDGKRSGNTHGSQITYGAMPDFVAGLHLATGGGQSLWIERKSKPVVNDAFVAKIGARLIRDDDIFNAATGRREGETGRGLGDLGPFRMEPEATEAPTSTASRTPPGPAQPICGGGPFDAPRTDRYVREREGNPYSCPIPANTAQEL